MIVDLFTPGERRAFLHLARQLMVSDGRIHEEERLFLHEIAGDLDLYRELANPMSPERALASFETTAARELALLELLRLSYQDGDQAIGESALLKRVGETFGFAPEKVEAMDAELRRRLLLGSEALRELAERIRQLEASW